MAEILAATKPGKRKLHSLKVDLTPMVDLGFLLISFFVFTSTMMKPMMLSLILPDDSREPTKIPESGAVTLLVSGQSVFYYEGKTPGAGMTMQQFSMQQKDELRIHLLQLQQRLVQAYGNDDKLMVIIKPTDDSQLKQLVAILDEMSICNIRRYALENISMEESNLLLQRHH